MSERGLSSPPAEPAKSAMTFAGSSLPTSSTRGIALCSDAMNEGINLQGGSAVVQFDMPTTLRVAEQRVGRVDRMDSPHDRIEVFWPADSRRSRRAPMTC